MNGEAGGALAQEPLIRNISDTARWVAMHMEAELLRRAVPERATPIGHWLSVSAVVKCARFERRAPTPGLPPSSPIREPLQGPRLQTQSVDARRLRRHASF